MGNKIFCVWLLMLEGNWRNSSLNCLVNTWQELLSIVCYHGEDWNRELFDYKCLLVETKPTFPSEEN